MKIGFFQINFICVLIFLVLEIVFSRTKRRSKGQGIYEIIQKDNREVVYIGKTNNFGRREYEHRKSKYSIDTYDFRINKLMNDDTPVEQIYTEEKQLIIKCKEEGFCKHNKRAGGGGPR